jgi:serine/threonine protein phosphatase 1
LESIRHFYVHACYDPHLPLSQQNWNALRWASLPSIPEPHCSGKIAIVGHTP